MPDTQVDDGARPYGEAQGPRPIERMPTRKRLALIAHDNCKGELLRVSVVHNVPIACNRSTADFLLSSPLMHREYERLLNRAAGSDPVRLTLQS